MKEKNNKRNTGYELIRIVACFMVLVSHIITRSSYPVDAPYSRELFLDDFLFLASKMNVTSFILVSGALLLGKEEKYKDWLLKRVLRIVAVILVFSAIYYDWNNGNIRGYLFTIFSGAVTNAFWYLYLYIGIMILLPVLRKLAGALSEYEYRYLFLLFALSQGMYPVMIYFFGFPSCHSIISSMFSTYISWIVVFLLGYYLFVVHKVDAMLSSSKCVALFVVWVICNLIPTVVTYYDFHYREATYYFMDNAFLIWSMFATICVDLLLLFIARQIKNEHIHRIIQLIGNLTFGIYLFGDKLIDSIAISFWPFPLSVTSKELIFCMTVFVVGGIITFIIKKIPLVNWLI